MKGLQTQLIKDLRLNDDHHDHGHRAFYYYTMYDSISNEISKKGQEITRFRAQLIYQDDPSEVEHQLNKVYGELHAMVHERDSLQHLVDHWPGDTTLTRQLAEVKQENVQLRLVQTTLETESRYWQLLM